MVSYSSQPPVYIDIDTGDIITGGHRHDACSMLGIPGYMFVFVRCDSDWARKRFAKTLNNERVFHATLNNEDEVVEHITVLLRVLLLVNSRLKMRLNLLPITL